MPQLQMCDDPTPARAAPRGPAIVVDDLRLRDAAEMEDLTGQSARRWLAMARDNLCPHVRQGRQVRFHLPTILAWIAQGGTAHALGWRRAPCAPATPEEPAPAVRRGRRSTIGV